MDTIGEELCHRGYGQLVIADSAAVVVDTPPAAATKLEPV